MAASPIRPRLRTSKPSPEVVEAFEEACARELRTPGKVLEALMISFVGMTPASRDELAILRSDHLKQRGMVTR
ncbi:hypothetical protein PSMK_p00800 (plasmid) [Phycisphaera mikurensis NBRC 102666]|uniref:Uncharacterized protein n=1 Tax=Phycisphaera mikurensis (strain NBRC 102666 / KCTC 22515 / FYK2301M01) TaxID=1142394 RepID=I0IJK4_PHYMF|nr:hypothetical protein [Phycisphaera mikurensis]BAM05442.1 hypothetical protein PSMK_p00800 [Phycisphaera mikurensis NBRC 102666]